jgi:hypothetical protein
MEKALHSAHGIGYEVYSRNHTVRMRVEKRRKMDYIKCRRLVADLDRLVHYNNRLKI